MTEDLSATVVDILEISNEVLLPDNENVPPLITSATNDSISASATEVDVAITSAVPERRLKNSMLGWVHKLTEEELIKKREEEAVEIEKAKQSKAMRARQLTTGVKVSTKGARKCTEKRYNELYKIFKDIDKIVMTYDSKQSKIWCKACAAFIREDAAVGHVVCQKHLNNRAKCLKRQLYQSKMELILMSSSEVSKEIDIFYSC